MSRRTLVKLSLGATLAGVLALALGCATKPTKAAEVKPAPVVQPAPTPPPEKLPPVMLGIDVLEAERFAPIAGRKIGLLTHPAGVNRRGESTVDVLRRAPNVKLVALFAPEHGIEGTIKAGENFNNTIDPRTGLPVYALYGQSLEKAKGMVKGLDALVVDLQDIGVRSYTFNVIMRYAMEACFENGVEVIVLDRPNPLGGLKVDGPPLDPENWSGVGAYPRMPYVHGLTIGEIALMAKYGSRALVTLPVSSGMALSDAVRAKGKLTVIPMRGWTRAMRWPETELKWVPTSPNIPTFDAVVGYAMVGLGTLNSGWAWGIGHEYHFRAISFPKKTPDEIVKAMDAYKIPGIAFVKRNGVDVQGKPVTGVYVEVTDWNAWHPTELSFYLHKQAARWSRLNPFAVLTSNEQRTFKIHVGSNAWFAALAREGGGINVASFLANWAARADVYRAETKKFWLYQ
ncbi:MAG TPA: DUF1343 domain-containing protein [Lacunisphaera sp.]|jgi:uncharacterized protein YbbC (DUF1343 family)|nr:DUF1343 domain-containing protein [Lacunisphaera sp.]